MTLRTLNDAGRYAVPRVGISEEKRPVEERTENRIRAHLREAMVEHGLGLNETARLLKEDPSAISRVLSEVKPRSPTVYIVARMAEVFGIKHFDLFRRDPDARFWEPGTPQIDPSSRRPSPPPPSDASPGAAHPGKRRTGGGGMRR